MKPIVQTESQNSLAVNTVVKSTDQSQTQNQPLQSTTSTDSYINNVTVTPSPTLPSPRPTDIEVPDMLNGSHVVYNGSDVAVKHNVNYSIVDEPLKTFEFIDDDPRDTEDSKIMGHAVSEESTGVVQGQLAAVLAGLFVVIAIIGYIGLISWRRYLE